MVAFMAREPMCTSTVRVGKASGKWDQPWVLEYAALALTVNDNHLYLKVIRSEFYMLASRHHSNDNQFKFYI